MGFECACFEQVRLGDVAKFRAGSVFKPDEQGQRSGDIPFIKVSDLNLPSNFYKIVEANNWLSFDAAKRLRTTIHPAGATVFAKIGIALTYNRRRLLVRDTAIDNNLMSATPDRSRVRPDFLYYTLRCLDFNEIAKGSALPYINMGDLQSLPIRLPPRSEQAEICAVLGGLDDRIDLLRQTNTTLETIAQALFKSWFVDFDPVHAKAEGREPEAMDAAIAALFPSEFEESELGPIPKGWRAGRLGNVSSNPRDQAKPGKIDPDTPYFGLEHMPRKSIALSDHGTADGLGSGKFWFEESDILFGKLRPYFHKVGLAPFKGICSTDILVLRPLQRAFHAFLLMHASSDTLIAYATRLSNGAKMPRSSWKDIANYPICIPSDPAAQAFNEAIEPMVIRVKANVRAAVTLTQLRDTLLPRLISGKLRLPDDESVIEEAVA